MKTYNINAYNLGELPQEVREKVLEQHRNINVEYSGWSDFVLDEHRIVLADKGFTEPKFHYSGFWSQGDGASFDANVDTAYWLRQAGASPCQAERLALHVSLSIEKNSLANHYSHENTRHVVVDANIDETKNPRIYNVVYKAAELAEAARSRLSHELYQDLESEFEGLTSDEAVKDTIWANEYEFTIDGQRLPASADEPVAV